MILIDVNIAVYAHRTDSQGHRAYKAWWTSLLNGETHFCVADETWAAFLRIVTHPGLFNQASPLDLALRFVEEARTSPAYRQVVPGPGRWDIFLWLVKTTGARGNLIPDVWLASLALEQRLEIVTEDRDFARFPGLRWRHPLEGPNDLGVLP